MSKLKELDKFYENYVGIDWGEAGRGNVAGSLFFCAAKLKPNKTLEDLSIANDSKSMSKKKRTALYEKLIDIVDYKFVEIYPEFIDDEGLSEACRYSLHYLKRKFQNDKILYDGKTTFKVDGIETLVKADAKVSIVAAASIIAKTLKDKNMEEWAERFPEYDFENNAGYGTKKHIEAIKKYGYTIIHRRSFNIKALKNNLEKDK